MRKLKEKFEQIRIVYVPFVLILCATIITYGFIRWFLDVKHNLIPIDNSILEFWIPLALAFLIPRSFLLKRTQILDVKYHKTHDTFVLMMAMTIVMIGPLFVSQNYVGRAFYELKTIEKVNQISGSSNDRYFNVMLYHIDKENCAVNIALKKIDKGRHLQQNVYRACAFDGLGSDVWYAIKEIQKLHEKPGSAALKTEGLNLFKIAIKSMEKYNYKNVGYFEKLGVSYDYKRYVEAIKKTKPYEINNSDPIILIPHYDSFLTRMDSTIQWFWMLFGGGLFVILAIILYCPMHYESYNKYINKLPMNDIESMIIYRFIGKQLTYAALPVLLGVNILIFFVMVFMGMDAIDPRPDAILDFGALRRQEVLNGEYWRLISYAFIHSSIWHLVANLVGLFLGVFMLKDYLKFHTILWVYISCVIGAGLVSILWMDKMTVGASGGVMGMFGIMMSFNLLKLDHKYIRDMAWTFISLYAFPTIIFGLIGIYGSVNNAAHIGGLLSGIFLGYFLGLRIRESNLYEKPTMLG